MLKRKSPIRSYLLLLSALLIWRPVSSFAATENVSSAEISSTAQTSLSVAEPSFSEHELSFFRAGSANRYEDSGSPIYSPSLPPSEFLNAEQKKLGETLGDDLSKFVEFVDSDSAVAEGVKCPLKPWTKDEKDDITRILTCLLHRGPGVLVRAAANGPVKLARAATFRGSTAFSKGNSFMEDEAPLAAAHECSIVLSDRFFRCDQQGHGLIHELVHIADSGDRTAFSKEWAGFALPEISKIRKNTSTMSVRQMATYQNEFRKAGDWPSLYATVNMREALSEYMSEYVMGTEFTLKPEFITKIGAPFLAPTANDLKWLSSVQSGMLLMGKKAYATAVPKFEEAIELAPWSPMPYLFVAHCSVHWDKDYSKSDKMIAKAIACFDGAGIPAQEPDTKQLVPLRASVLAEQGDYMTAIKLLDQVLLESPNYREALVLRSWCRYHRGNLSQSAEDYYLAKCGADDYSWALFNAPASRAETRSGIVNGAASGGRSIEEDRRSIALAIKRILHYEKVGHKKLALAEYNSTVKKIEALERKLAGSRIAN
jgi:hypothetical protein